MNSAESEDSTEEEILIYVKCEYENLNNIQDKNFKIIGLDTDHPLMLLNGKFYEGTYEDAVGTHLFFENTKNPVVKNDFESSPSLAYIAKTRKVLQMQRVFVMPKSERTEHSEHGVSNSNVDDNEK